MVILVAAMSSLVLLAAGGLLTEVGPWYRALRKPRLQPPDWLFGPAWTLVLASNAVAGVLAWRTGRGHAMVGALLAANFVLHLLWSPIFFKARRPDWALAENCLLWCSVLALVVGLYGVSPACGWLEVPYLAWVSFAWWLNWSIVRLNGPFRGRKQAVLF